MMDADSPRDVRGCWRIAEPGRRTGRDSDPETGRHVPRSIRGVGRSRGQGLPFGAVALLATALVALVSAVFVVVTTGVAHVGSGGLGSLGGFLAFGVVGLAASSDGEDAITTLTNKVERARAGEQVEFETDREDGLGDLAAAVEGLADECRTAERERDLHERVIESVPVGVSIADATAEGFPLISVNERFEELTGYDESEVLGRNCRFLQGEETAEEPVAEMRRALEAGEETTVELRNYRKDGTAFWNQVRLAPIEDDDGEVTHFVGFQEDVSERVERQAELERRNSLFESLFEELPVHIYVKDEEARHVRVSSEFFDISDVEQDPSDMYGRTDVEIFDADFAKESYADDLHVIEEGEPIVNREEYLEHVDQWNLTTKVPWRGPDGEVQGLLGISRDITERKERERELAQYRAYTDRVLDSIDDVLYVLEEDGTLDRWNETLSEVTGYDDEEIESMHATEFIVEEDRPAIQHAIDNIDEIGDVPLEARFETKDGETIPYEFVAAPFEPPDGGEAVAGIARDISERKERERELESMTEQLSAIVEASPDAVMALDTDGTVELWNPAAERIFGWSEAEVLGEELPITPEETSEETEALRERLLAGESVSAREVERVTKDGSVIDVSLSAAPMRDSEGAVIGIMGVMEDITERKERERRLEALVENTEDPIYFKDREGRYQFINEAGSRVFGLDREETVGKTDHELVDEQSATAVTSDDRQVIETGEPLSNEMTFQSEDDERTFLDHKYPYRDDDGEIIGVMGISRDITQRKESERALREREERLEEYKEYTEEILDAIDDVFYAVDERGDLQRWNQAVADVTGYDEEEIESMLATDFFAEADQPTVAAAIAQAVETGDARVEVPLLRDDGEQVPHEFVASRVQNPDGETMVVGVGRDITDQKQAREELLERERRLEEYREYTEDILDAIDDVFYVLDENGSLERWNQALVDVTGYDDDEIDSMQATDFFAEADQPDVAEAIQRAVETGDTRVEAPFLTKDGEQIPYEFEASRLENPDGETVVVGIGRDITDRKAAQSELLEREQRLEEYKEYTEDILDAIDDVFYVFDDTGSIQRWNDSLVDVTGYTDEDIESMHGTDFFPEHVHDTVLEAIPAVFASGEDRRVDAPVLTKDGEEVPYEFVATRVENPDGEPVLVGVGRDISERKARERELRRTKDRLQHFIEISPVGIVATDPGGRVTLWNDAMEEIFGWSEREVLGEPYPAIPPERRGEDEVRQQVLHGESFKRVECKRVRNDGEAIDISLSTVPIRDDEGDISEIVGYIEDITERKERQRELERTTDLLSRAESMADVGGWTTHISADGTESARWTDNVYEIFEVPPEEGPLTDDILEYIDPAHREDHGQEIERAIEHGEPWDSELRITTGEGNSRWVHSLCEPVVEDGSTVELRGSLQDITERKQREREIERTADLLSRAEEMADVGGWTQPVRSDGLGPVEWTDNVYDIFEIPQSEGPLDEDLFEYIHPDDREAHRAENERAVEAGEPWDTEYRITTGTGTERWIHSICEPVAEDGEVVELRGSIQDITERKQRERELERTKDLLQQAGSIAAVGGWELDLTGDSPEMTWSDELYRIHGVSPDTDIDLETAVEFYHPQDQPKIRKYFQQAVEAGESYDMEVRLQPAAESMRWVRAIGEPVYEDGEVVRIRGSIQDITPQKERELALESLHEATRGLLGVDNDTETARLVVDTAQTVLDVGGVAVYLLDESTNMLDAVACSSGFERLCASGPVGASDSDSLLWNTYVTGRPTVFDDTQAVANSRVFGAEVGGGLLVPLGDHGVFVVATEDRVVDPETRQLAETLVATTEAAFDRLASEATLRERDEELAEQNRALRRQIQITNLLRRIDQSLIQAGSREDVEAAVCDGLVESDDIAFAWIGALDVTGEHVEPGVWAGDGTGYLDSVSLATAGEAVEPSAATAISESPTVVRNVVEDLKREPWRKTALGAEFQSVLSVPLAFEEYFYGVLTVYANEPEVFGDLEREVFAELGENIAHSINAVETQRALHTDQRVELTLDFEAGDDVLGRLATEAGCEIEFAGLAAQSETETDLFIRASGAPTAQVAGVLDDLHSVSAYRIITDEAAEAEEAGEDPPEDASVLIEMAIDSDTLPARFVRHGAGPNSIRATAGGIVTVVDVPPATDVRSFVEMLQETHPSADLVSRQTVERSEESGATLVNSLFDALTERQLEVLRTAYFAGFFEWPRTSTGEDVAEMLGVSQPTVNRHLRLGQQRLLEQLFEERSAEVVVEAD